MYTLQMVDCAKMIRAALKQGFPHTKFSVRSKSYSMGHSIDVRWTDGPTDALVKPILDRFQSKGFDGMTDSSYSCGDRTLLGVRMEVNGGYVRGQREVSRRLREIVSQKLAAECGLVVALDEYGNVTSGGTDPRVPFNWHMNWKDGGFTVDEFQNEQYVLASDSHNGEWFSTLVWRVESCISLEAQRPISPDLLPEYIDVTAEVSTGRASFEPPQKMFEGHAALDAAITPDPEPQPAVTSVTPPVADFHCSLGRSYPRLAREADRYVN